MASDNSVKLPRAGLSLYANLLDPTSSSSAPGTISRAAVVFKQSEGGRPQQDESSAQRQQISAASLRFQPTKRPQVQGPKSKSKSSSQKHIQSEAKLDTNEADSARQSNVGLRQPSKSTLADWAAEPGDDEVNGFQNAERRQRGGRKKRKKIKDETQIIQNWDDIYDPSRPNSYEEYQNSDERILELREWKDRLYAHRQARRSSSSDSGRGDHSMFPMSNNTLPPGLSFAPPPHFEDIQPTVGQANRLEESGQVHSPYASKAQVNDQKTTHLNHEEPFLPESRQETPAMRWTAPTDPELKSFVPAISRAPVRYNFPPPPAEIPNSEAELENALEAETIEANESVDDEAPRSLRPGQKGFAERLMSKYGWTKGSGLGASGTGILNPLRVQMEKQKKKPDSEGGGFAGPGGKGKILGGKKSAVGESAGVGKFGAMSEVIVLYNMVDGMDLNAEMDQAGDGGLMQEIGDECSNKYGRVERVFIDRTNSTKPPVFIKFTSQLSALRAVNALEGRIFSGNTITARFYDVEKFEAGTFG